MAALVISFIFLLTGCPYESEVSLGSPQKTKIDEMLLGRWKPIRDGEKPSGFLTIYAFNKHEYLIIAQDLGESAVMLMRAFGTVIDGEKFLNVQDLKSTDVKNNKWLFVNYSVIDDRLKYKVVDEKLFTSKYTSTGKLVVFIRKNLRNPDLYGDNTAEVLQRLYPKSKNGVPPLDLIKSNYKKALFVVTVRLNELEIQKSVRADNGSIGYVITRESGTILRTFKGPLKPGLRITYHDWLEYQPEWKHSRGGILLVFLQKDPKTGAFKTIGEASVFRMTSELNKMILPLTRSF